MALPYHTHTFVLPTATKRDVENATRSDLVVVPNSLGSMASKDESQYATAEQGQHADDALNWIDETGRGFEDAIQQFIDNGFPNYVTDKPYASGSYVRYTSGSSGTGVYRSIIDNNTSAPNTANWERIRSLAFKDKIDISDINATGGPSDQTYLRGDGEWSSVAALVNGRNSFVVNSGEPFPNNGERVVYAMNGPNAPANPNATYWYPMGTLSSKDQISLPDINYDGPPPVKDESNAICTNDHGTLYWYRLGTICPININGNSGQYLNGAGQWSTPPQPQPTGFWINLSDQPNNIWSDENVSIGIYTISAGNYVRYNFSIFSAARIVGVNGSYDPISVYFANGASNENLFRNLLDIHITDSNAHYHVTADRLFVDKR